MKKTALPHHSISLPMTDEEWDKIHKFVAHHGYRLSGWVKRLMMDHIAKVEGSGDE